jgi:hypothetical protein
MFHQFGRSLFKQFCWMVQILWKPETGDCDFCDKNCTVRWLTCSQDMNYAIVCLCCWNSFQDESNFMQTHWNEDEAIIFEIENSTTSKLVCTSVLN